MLDKAANPATSNVISKKYEEQAEEYLVLQAKYKDELTKINAVLGRVDDVSQKFTNKTEQLTIEEIFTSNEVAREIVGLFIKSIVVDDQNDKITIKFN